ncbi:hypothetical protein [Pararhodobacter aggregans]
MKTTRLSAALAAGLGVLMAGAGWAETLRIGVNDGAQCGPGWDGYVRFNYATTPALMDDLCARLTRALTEGR